MTCSECKHWKEWKEETDYPIGDCYECSYAKTFGKSVRPHDATCKSFQRKDEQAARENRRQMKLDSGDFP